MIGSDKSWFEFVVAEGDPIGFLPADTAGLDKWTKTASFDSIFRVAANSFHFGLPL